MTEQQLALTRRSFMALLAAATAASTVTVVRAPDPKPRTFPWAELQIGDEVMLTTPEDGEHRAYVSRLEQDAHRLRIEFTTPKGSETYMKATFDVPWSAA